MEPYLVSVYVFLTVIFFKIRTLHIKRLQEKGVSAQACLYAQRFAFLPTIILLYVTYKPEYLHIIISDPQLILYVFGMLTFWVLQEFISLYLIGKVVSLSFLNALTSTINIPMYIIIGFLINGDYPHYFIMISGVILMISMYIKPSQNSKRGKKMFLSHSTLLIFLSIIGVGLDGFGNAFHRELLQNLNAILFGTGIGMFLATVGVYVFFLCNKISENDAKLVSKNKYLYFSIAPLWFIGSIPEGYSLANIPIYTILAIGSVSFLIDVISDFKNERILLDKKTYFFVLLVLTSIIFSVLSVS